MNKWKLIKKKEYQKEIQQIEEWTDLEEVFNQFIEDSKNHQCQGCSGNCGDCESDCEGDCDGNCSCHN